VQPPEDDLVEGVAAAADIAADEVLVAARPTSSDLAIAYRTAGGTPQAIAILERESGPSGSDGPPGPFATWFLERSKARADPPRGP
jgi:hypothetical protein